MRKLIWVAVALASFSGLVAMAQVMVPPPGPGMPPGYGGYTPMMPMPPSPPMYGYPPPGMMMPAPGPGMMPFGAMPPPKPGMPTPPPPVSGRPTAPPLPGQPAPPLPPMPPTPPYPQLPGEEKKLPDMPPPPPDFLPPQPPIERAPPLPPPPSSEPYSVYEGAAAGPRPLTEPMAVYEGKRYDAATRNDHYHCWASLSYLHLWIRPNTVPPLVTAGTGPLTDPGTSVALGGAIGPDEFSGATGTLGFWIDQAHTTSFEATAFLLGQHSMMYNSSSGNTGGVLSIPVLVNNVDTIAMVAAPDFATGNVSVNDSFSLWGAEANFYQSILRYECFSIDLLSGFRTLHMQDVLSIDQHLVSLGGVTFNGAAVPAGTSVFISDSFTTINRYYGGQIGARFAITCGPVEVAAVAKTAMGATQSSTAIAGMSSVPTLGLNANRGLFAQSTNIGKSYSTEFATVSEVMGTLSVQLSPYVRVLAGYQYLYWDRLERAGDQIDRNINAAAPAVNSIVGTGGSGPNVPHSHTNFWAHGFNVGIEFRY